MKKALLIVFLLCFKLELISQINRDLMSPRELTLQFIEDYKKWNDFAFQNSKEETVIEEKYKHEVIDKYCLPDKKFQNISYGNESSHCPLKEKIVSENVRTNVAVINTKYRDPKLKIAGDKYEYHFVKVNDTWYLSEVYLVDKDGKFEGL